MYYGSMANQKKKKGFRGGHVPPVPPLATALA